MRNFILYTAYGTFIYAICAGFRDNYGIMLPYLVEDSGLNYAAVSFVIALGQLFFGLMQPVFGYLSLRKSPLLSLVLGVALMLGGLLLMPYCRSLWSLGITLGILLPSGTAAASFGILMSCITPRIQEAKSQLSAGIVASGIGIGICVLSPVIQGALARYGVARAISILAILVALIVPAAILLTRGGPRLKMRERALPFAAILLMGLKNSPYCRVAFAFFTCGFHMALIQTHLFSQLTLYGLPGNVAAWGLSIYGLGVIAGSVGSGALGARYSMSRVLGGIYASRIIWVALLLLSSGPIAIFGVIFMLGATGVATLAPTAGIITRIFGAAIMPTLFGVAYVLHQIGAFASAWCGGICYQLTSGYSAIWMVDMLLCLLAALAVFSIGVKGLVPHAAARDLAPEQAKF